MRPIRFRVWDKKRMNMQLPEIYGFNITSEGELFFGNYPDGTPRTESHSKYVIMQYTGLKDKNGADDYHKDICEYYDDSGTKQIGIVEWRGGAWWLQAIGGDDEGNQDVMLAYADHEIIGNIYEHKELIS